MVFSSDGNATWSSPVHPIAVGLAATYLVSAFVLSSPNSVPDSETNPVSVLPSRPTRNTGSTPFRPLTGARAGWLNWRDWRPRVL
jgi:hypothetical protein